MYFAQTAPSGVGAGRGGCQCCKLITMIVWLYAALHSSWKWPAVKGRYPATLALSRRKGWPQCWQIVSRSGDPIAPVDIVINWFTFEQPIQLASLCQETSSIGRHSWTDNPSPMTFHVRTSRWWHLASPAKSLRCFLPISQASP